MTYTKQNPVCSECTGWYLEVMVDKVKWLKCNSCGHMKLVSNRVITPVGSHED